ncbi:MAG: DUF1788 domain-containing protein [bacterium]
MDLNSRLNKILEIIQSPGFLERKGLGNEIAYFIFDYPPHNELAVRQHIKYLLRKLSYDGSPFRAVELNLYDVVIDVLRSQNLFDKSIDMETKKGRSFLFTALKPVLKPEKIVNIIGEKAKGNNLLFLTGIGCVWPLLRSHNVLNNLHSVLDNIPIIMFFPGEYDGAELMLFGKFKDDNYYRAFRLVEEGNI